MIQDHDGSHIKGLIINFLDHFYPSLLKIPNFLVEFITPIVRVTKGKQRIDFFTIPEYEQWLERTHDAHKWDSKYYKVRCFYVILFASRSLEYDRVLEETRTPIFSTISAIWRST